MNANNNNNDGGSECDKGTKWMYESEKLNKDDLLLGRKKITNLDEIKGNSLLASSLMKFLC